MTRSHKANQNEPKSSTILNAPDTSRTKKDGAGKSSKGNAQAQIQEGIQEAKQRAFSSSPPNSGQSMKIVIIKQDTQPSKKQT